MSIEIKTAKRLCTIQMDELSERPIANQPAADVTLVLIRIVRQQEQETILTVKFKFYFTHQK